LVAFPEADVGEGQLRFRDAPMAVRAASEWLWRKQSDERHTKQAE
jgi:hypothetical protein